MDLKQFCKAIGIDKDEPILTDINGMPFVRSPFYTGMIILEEEWIERLKLGVELKKADYDKYVATKKYGRAIFTVERPFRFDYFLRLEFDICKNKGKRKAGKLLSDVWIDAENPGINIKIWKMCFAKYGKNLMTDSEKEFLENLPDKFTVYHGDEGEHDGMISWTLDRSIAEFFAQRFTNDSRAVTKKEINKLDALCYFERRGEKEIIIL